ncbi:MAG: hypothetical protein N2490_00280 [Ignavibacteria bacterium]|nr:hypothetical protein [Ignavibacteria bacterium]
MKRKKTPKRRIINVFIILFFSLLLFFLSCELKEPSAPNWLVSANLPITDRVHNIIDLLKDEGDIYYDEEGNAYFSDETSSSSKFEKKIIINGYPGTTVNFPTQVSDTIFDVPFDDSSYVTSLYFEPHDTYNKLIINFNPSLNFVPYTITITILNLIEIENNQPLSLTRTIYNTTYTDYINLHNFYINNSYPSNLLNIRINTTSSQFTSASLSYNVSPLCIKSVVGRIKPVNLGTSDTLIKDPFGYHSLEGEMNFASVNPQKTYLVVKRKNSTYQVDIREIQMTGINYKGKRMKFKYLRYDTIGAPPQPIDSIFNLRIPEGQDSAIYYVNPSNSNILQFFNHVPKRIEITRYNVINLNYSYGNIANNDSIYMYLTVELPLHFSIVEPTTFRDTVIKSITDPKAREKLRNTRWMDLKLFLTNGLPLLASVRILIQDSLDNLLFAVTQIVVNGTGDSILVPAAPVDYDGYVITPIIHEYTGFVDSVNTQKLLEMGKIVYEYKLYTDPNVIPAPDGRVRIRDRDYIRQLSYGTFRYFLNNNTDCVNK